MIISSSIHCVQGHIPLFWNYFLPPYNAFCYVPFCGRGIPVEHYPSGYFSPKPGKTFQIKVKTFCVSVILFVHFCNCIVYALLLFSLVIVLYMLFCIVIVHVFVWLYGLYVRVSPCTGNLPFVYPFKQIDLKKSHYSGIILSYLFNIPKIILAYSACPY